MSLLLILYLDSCLRFKMIHYHCIYVCWMFVKNSGVLQLSSGKPSLPGGALLWVQPGREDYPRNHVTQAGQCSILCSYSLILQLFLRNFVKTINIVIDQWRMQMAYLLIIKMMKQNILNSINNLNTNVIILVKVEGIIL